MSKTEKRSRILIDADGCPVVDVAISLSKKHKIECIIFCDTAHEFNRDGARTVVVDQGPDSVDFALTNAIEPGDIVITQDYGLAAMAISRKACVFNVFGKQYTDSNIDMLLTARYEMKVKRNRGEKIKGPSKRKKEDNNSFFKEMDVFLSQI